MQLLIDITLCYQVFETTLLPGKLSEHQYFEVWRLSKCSWDIPANLWLNYAVFKVKSFFLITTVSFGKDLENLNFWILNSIYGSLF